MGPHSGESGQQILILREFDLGLCVGGLCAFCKYVENQACAVENLHLKLALEVGDLLGGEVVIEYHESYFVFVDILLYLVKLSLSHIGARVGVIESLQECLFGDRSRRVGEKSEFIEILLGLSLILLRGY